MAAGTKYGKWAAGEKVYGGLDGGFPLAVFDANMDAAVVLSPFNSFMSATQASFASEKGNDTNVAFGPLPSVKNVSAFEHPM